MTPNVARTIYCKAWNSPAEYPSWVARCDIEGSDGIMLNPIFWKKVQGQKHPGRWGIVEHQIPSIKVLFKTNAKSHKHPGIKPSPPESKTQLANQRKQNSHRYIYQHRALGREQRPSGGNTSSIPQVSTPVPRPAVNGMEMMCQCYGSDQTPTLMFESKNHVSINSYSTTYAAEESLLSTIPNSVIVRSPQ